MTSAPRTLCAVTDATWPAAAVAHTGPWTIREGRGGGKRVSAATARGPVTPADLPAAEALMRALGQAPLFMIRSGEAALDAMLAARGYARIDPVNAWAGPAAPLAERPLPRGRVFCIWEPLAIQADMWAAGGIGPARLAVMRRAPGPKTSILARWDQTPAATAFVAIHDRIAMVHALEVAARCRRKGVARLVMVRAARWANENGAGRIAALCTRENAGANALYSSLGLTVVGQYHYRMAEEDRPA